MINSAKILFNTLIFFSISLYAASSLRTDRAIFESIAPSEEIRKIEKLFWERCRDYIEYEDFSDCVKPSFDCAKAKKDTELFICQSNSLAKIDNFFTSYYNLIIKNIPENEKPKVRNIARKMMKERDKCDLELPYLAKDDDVVPGKVLFQIENDYLAYEDFIVWSYRVGIQDLTEYLLKNNPKLFAEIFYKHTEEYKDILRKYDALWSGLFYLYYDNLIDETGKLIIRVDSKGLIVKGGEVKLE